MGSRAPPLSVKKQQRSAQALHGSSTLGTAGTARPPLPSLQEICVDFRRIVHRREKRARTTQAAICSWPEPFNPWGSIAGSQRGRFLASAQVQMALGLRRRGRKPRARSRGWSMESRRGRAGRRRAAAAGGGGGWPRFPARGSGGFLLCDPLCFLNTGTAHEGTCRSVGIACRCWDQEALGSHLSVVHMSLHLRVFPRAKRSGRGS